MNTSTGEDCVLSCSIKTSTRCFTKVQSMANIIFEKCRYTTIITKGTKPKYNDRFVLSVTKLCISIKSTPFINEIAKNVSVKKIFGYG